MFYNRFQRRVNTGDTSQDRILTEKQYLLLAVGSLNIEGTEKKNAGNTAGSTFMMKHILTAASDCAYDVIGCSDACSCPGGFFYQMLKLHGMYIKWITGLIIPFDSVRGWNQAGVEVGRRRRRRWAY